MTAATEADRHPQPLEELLLDLRSLGQRLDWSQLASMMARVTEIQTVHQLAEAARLNEDRIPAMFAAVELSGRPAAVAQYLSEFSRTGSADLQNSLRYGAGGIKALLSRQHPLHVSKYRERLAEHAPFSAVVRGMAGFAWEMPGLALVVKWLCYIWAGFLLAAAMHFAWPPVSPLEQPLQVPGFHLLREFLFALGFLLVVLLLSEPFLAQPSQTAEWPFLPAPPPTDGAVPTEAAGADPQSLMNDPSLMLPLLLFFALQALLYVACLFKLAEIRRQNVPARIKLKLLENEDHLFDAGLYLGFVGTIISLILASMGVTKFSLMAAYSATSFGIIFVSFFKICNLRPTRRRLLMEAEAMPSEPQPAAPTTPRPLPTVS